MNSRLSDSDIESESLRGTALTAASEIGFSLSALRAALVPEHPARELHDDEIVTVRVSIAARGGWQDSTSLLLATADGGGARK